MVGSRVTLPCRVEKKSGQLQWTKDDFGLGLHRDLSGYDRYKMIGSDEEGTLMMFYFTITFISEFIVNPYIDEVTFFLILVNVRFFKSMRRQKGVIRLRQMSVGRCQRTS